MSVLDVHLMSEWWCPWLVFDAERKRQRESSEEIKQIDGVFSVANSLSWDSEFDLVISWTLWDKWIHNVNFRVWSSFVFICISKENFSEKLSLFTQFTKLNLMKIALSTSFRWQHRICILLQCCRSYRLIVIIKNLLSNLIDCSCRMRPRCYDYESTT